MQTDLIMRLMVLLILASAFLISGLYRQRARSEGETIERIEEGLLPMTVRLIFGFSIIAVLLFNIFFGELMLWSKINFPLWVRIFGAATAVVSILLLWWVFRSLGANISETILTKDEHQLVTTGPYKWVRHPLYTCSLLMLFSISLMLEDWVLLLFSIAGLLVFRLLVIPAEEEKLLDKFGEEYQIYQTRTGAMFPWVW
jgi:protein-S-isoprenylcysteine O-methyltransferase Ste14